MTQTPNEGRVPEPSTGRRGGSRGGATPSRVGSLWVASILFAVVLLLLLIFVLQNGQDAKISYLGAHGSLPQGVALLLAAVFGILLVALPGTARIIQLRIRDRRHRDAARTRPTDAQPTHAQSTHAQSTEAPPSGTPPTRIPQHDVTPPTTNPPIAEPSRAEPSRAERSGTERSGTEPSAANTSSTDPPAPIR